MLQINPTPYDLCKEYCIGAQVNIGGSRIHRLRHVIGNLQCLSPDDKDLVIAKVRKKGYPLKKVYTVFKEVGKTYLNARFPPCDAENNEVQIYFLGCLIRQVERLSPQYRNAIENQVEQKGCDLKKVCKVFERAIGKRLVEIRAEQGAESLIEPFKKRIERGERIGTTVVMNVPLPKFLGANLL